MQCGHFFENENDRYSESASYENEQCPELVTHEIKLRDETIGYRCGAHYTDLMYPWVHYLVENSAMNVRLSLHTVKL